MSAKHIAVPDGCLHCNPERRQAYLEQLRALEIHVEAVPTPTTPTSDVIVCRRCGQAWLLMLQPNTTLPT